MKIRIGFGLGTGGTDPAAFADLVDALEDSGFDSLWLSERLTGESLDPMTALAVAAGRSRRMKLGTSVLVLPGRNPVMLAKEMATLDVLSSGRFLPALGLGAPDPAEHRAFGVERSERAAMFDEALPLMRRLWSEDSVTHHGRHYHVEDLSLRPRPRRDRLDVWLGGQAPSELRRVGRLGDGWLPSFCTPAEVAAGRQVIEETASAEGRRMDPEHWGVLVFFSAGPLPERLAAVLARRSPAVTPEELVPESTEALRRRIEAFVEVGFSKFVVVPASLDGDPATSVARLAADLLDLEN